MECLAAVHIQHGVSMWRIVGPSLQTFAQNRFDVESSTGIGDSFQSSALGCFNIVSGAHTLAPTA
uniref:Uncharacterized protein n=1 Tax=uncultured marine virus TaxID=186617 RepID=A0A0F7L9C2_9VIRU|nr:hypothetical protein [uncultured marine virus]